MSQVMIKAKGKPVGTISTHGGRKMVKTSEGWKPVKGERAARTFSEAKTKNLANEKDVAHSLEIIQAMYKRRPKGQGFEAGIASESDLNTILDNMKVGFIGVGARPGETLRQGVLEKRKQKMKDYFTDLGFVITETDGKYGEPEDSFMVMCHDADRRDMIRSGMMFQQESVIFVDSGQNEMIYTYGQKVGQTMAEGEGREKISLDADDNYTEVQAGSKKVRFSLNFSVWKSLRLVIRI